MKTYKEMVKEIKRSFMELLRSTDAALESVKECMQAEEALEWNGDEFDKEFGWMAGEASDQYKTQTRAALLTSSYEKLSQLRNVTNEILRYCEAADEELQALYASPISAR